MAALHGALPQRSPRPLPQRPARRPRRPDPPTVHRPRRPEARRRLADAISQLEPRLPKIARLLEEAEDDVLAFSAFLAEHWPKLRSTNPLERFSREIGRRTDVVGIFPDNQSVIRLVSMLAIEANDEWLVGRSYISRGSMATLYETQTDRPLPPRPEQEVAELADA